MTFQLPEGFQPITLQKIFNDAWQAFIVEKKPPAQVWKLRENGTGDGNYVCRYKTEGGLRCAVGCSIPEGHPYEGEQMDFLDLVRLERNHFDSRDAPPRIFAPELIEMAGEDDVERASRISRFQSRLHDDLAERGNWIVSPETMEGHYRQVAADFGLTIPGEEVE